MLGISDTQLISEVKLFRFGFGSKILLTSDPAHTETKKRAKFFLNYFSFLNFDETLIKKVKNKRKFNQQSCYW